MSYKYKMWTSVQTRGSVKTTEHEELSDASFYCTVVLNCIAEDETSYYISVNLYDLNLFGGGTTTKMQPVATQKVTNPTKIDLTTIPEPPSGSLRVNPGGEAVGNPLFFQQNKTGGVNLVWYNENDPPQALSLQISVVNLLQTNVGTLKEPTGSALTEESSCSGDRVTYYFSSGNTMEKTYSEKDYHYFSDPLLTPNNVEISGKGALSFHNDGHISTSILDETVTLVDASPHYAPSSMNQGDKRIYSSRSDDSSSTHVGPAVPDVELTAVGHAALSFIGMSPTTHMSSASFLDLVSPTQKFNKGTPSQVAAKLMQFITPRMVDVASSLDMVIKEDIGAVVLEDLITTLQNSPEDLPHLVRLLDVLLTFPSSVRDTLLYIAAVTSEENFLKFGLYSPDVEICVQAALMATEIPNPSKTTLEALADIGLRRQYSRVSYEPESKLSGLFFSDLKCAALVSYTQMIDKYESHRCLETFQNILPLLDDYSNPQMFCVLHALSYLPCGSIPPDTLERLLSHPNPSIQSTVSLMQSKKAHASSGSREQGFYRNYTFSKSILLGGHTINSRFYVDLFAGSNFNCASPADLQHSSMARINLGANTNFLGFCGEAFRADAYYSSTENVDSRNSVSVSVWGNVIYARNLNLDCSLHTSDITHFAPGFSTRYTVWVVGIPITFTAGVHLNFDLKWGWKICDSNLTAMMQLEPKAYVMFGGSAEVDLFLLKAGVLLQGGFGTEINPQAEIEGDHCSIRAFIKRTGPPLLVDLEAYHSWKHCHLLHKNKCSWGKQRSKVLWSWSLPSVDYVLAERDWDIR
ncbi:lipid transport family protein [Pelomyxa schiedti]|nr:lipid transport family protein [Pelomyxa schiedti]